MAKSIDAAAFIANNAAVTGDVSLGKDCSVWYGASLRGDLAPVTIGAESNIQDNASVHVDTNTPTIVGNGVTVGHNAILHGCTVEDNCLIGMGAIVLNRAVVGEGSVIGAGALITEGKIIPPRSLAVGSPAKVIRQIDDENLAKVKKNAGHYIELARRHKNSEF